ncbi:MAG TPA: BTAD domain-containing putative transcriptional regulator, partial [Anaerovoracaceae bacterium]|nr:BTAD domain-containing putative transcriptional regulator [Anaerovoracaceae bacterium]
TYRADQAEQYYFVQAALFGTPEIKVNGISIPDTEWKTKKVKAFFEYLLFQSGNTVSKEVLAELLWPGADSKSSAASQRTALYYLRKTLSKYHVEVTGINAFIQETPDGLKIRKDNVLELDLLDFLRLYKEWTMMEKQMSQNEQKLADVLKSMVQIYKGDLMESGDFGDLIFHERERLKSIFMEACQKLSTISVRNGDFRLAEDILRRAVAAEPYDENICLELLELYMLQGRKSKAIKLYYSFKKRLEQELGIRIDRRLTEAIR